MSERITNRDLDRAITALAYALNLKHSPIYLTADDIDRATILRRNNGDVIAAEYHSTLIDPRAGDVFKREPGSLHLEHIGNGANYRIDKWGIGVNYSNGRYSTLITSRGVLGPHGYEKPRAIFDHITFTIGVLQHVAKPDRLIANEGRRDNLDRAYEVACAGDPDVTAAEFCTAVDFVLNAHPDNRNKAGEWIGCRALEEIHSVRELRSIA